MAKKKKVKKAKKKGGVGQIFLIVGLLMAVVFLPSTVLLVIGMLPTVVVLFIDTSKRKTRALTIGAMNLAGCSPFLIELWQAGHTLDASVSIATQPMAVIVMYSASGVGYMIDWVMSGVVSSVLYQRGLTRQKAIKKRQKELVERWGKEVTGEIPLDEDGFALEQEPARPAAKAS